MNIGGFQPLTLSDFPGRTAAIIFTQGCNFRCPFCHNGGLLDRDVRPEGLMDGRHVLTLLAKRKKLLDGVVISGGEPTLQPNLLPFIRELRSLGLAIKLDTNGSRPEVIRQLLSADVLESIAMDVKAPFYKYDRLTGVSWPIDRVRESIALIAGSQVRSEFRTTWVPALLSESDIETIRQSVPEGCAYTVQAFIPDNALDTSLCTT